MRKTKTAVGISPEKLYLMRSYDFQHHTRDPAAFRSAETMPIWKIARAATAAPMYFKELKLVVPGDGGDSKSYFTDGGFGITNNPTLSAFDEMVSLYSRKNIGAIVSIGTARAHNESRRHFLGRVKTFASVATDPQTVADIMSNKNLENYWRFNDIDGMDVELDEWKPNGMFTKRTPGIETLNKIRDAFNKWFAKSLENSRPLEDCARHLVTRRRARTADTSRWQQFAIGAHQYSCGNPECEGDFETLETFLENHWQLVHEDEENGERWRQPNYKQWNYKIQNGNPFMI